MSTGSRGDDARMRRSVSMPPMPGMFMSSSTASNDLRAQNVQRHLAARHLDDLKSQFDQRRAKRAADGRFIVDYEDCEGSTASWGAPLNFRCVVAPWRGQSVALRSGMAAKNVVPSDSSLETQTDPLWASAARLAMESPMPVPAARD